MKKYILLLIITAFMAPTVSFASSIPSFPMAFYGNVTINNKKAPEGTIIRAYYGDTLTGSSTVDSSGAYGYTDSTLKKLLVGEGLGNITFSFQSSSILSNKESFGKTSISYPGFTEGLVVNKNLDFSYSTSSGGGGGGGGGSSSKTSNTVIPTPSQVVSATTIVNTNDNVNSFNFTGVIKLGSRGEQAKELQKILIEKGFLAGVADGSFGPMTLSAVKKFQEANGLIADGIVGPAVNVILNKSINLDPKINNPLSIVKPIGNYNFGTSLLKNGSTGEAVKELQRYLNDTLNLGLILDGKLGPKTIAVIKEWQKSKGLIPDGLVGPRTKALMK